MTKATYESRAAFYGSCRNEARAYYALCDRASRVGVPTDLRDPKSPRTVEALRAAVEQAEARS